MIPPDDIDVLTQDPKFKLLTVKLHFPSINMIEKVNDTILAHSDSRGFGDFVTF